MPSAVRVKRAKRKSLCANEFGTKKQKLTPTVAAESVEEHLFSIGKQISYKTITASLSQLEKNTKVQKWFENITNNVLKNSTNNYITVGLDCEWCPPWFRSPDHPEERICTMQFYNPNCDALVLSVVGVETLPKYLLEFFHNERILKVGVNIIGDGGRIKRDFKTTVNGLLNLEKLCTATGRMSMEKLVLKYCPKAFHISKGSMESKVRLGDWSKYPLDNLQVKYASLDAVLSFAILLFQKKCKWEDARHFSLEANDALISGHIQSVEHDPSDIDAVDKEKLRKKKISSEKSNSNFFIMHRNRSIVPPNLNSKEHPEGTKESLKGLVIVASGVLDSFSRKHFAEYVKRHGGKISTSITKSTSFLVNDHGTVGPSKLKKCRASGIPVVSEDHILELVRQSIAKNSGNVESESMDPAPLKDIP